MAEFPFELLVERSALKQKAESLMCTGILRAVRGKRDVYDATWQGRSVVVKAFRGGIRARLNLHREWHGLRLLEKRGLSAPRALFYGKTSDGRWAVVVEKITDSTTALEALVKSTAKSEKLNLLLAAGRELAEEHKKGVLQEDFHLGNFLWRQGRLFSVDPAQMRFRSSQVGRRQSIFQLALLARLLPENDTEAISRLYREYLEARRWRLEESDQRLLQKAAKTHRKNGIRNGLKKCLRTSRKYLRLRTPSYVAVFHRGFCDGGQARELPGQIDDLMDKGRILKNGNTCFVSHVKWNGKDVVVKRYNHKGFVHSLRHTLKRSRARQGWLHAHRLKMLRIATPRPLAYIERRKGLLIWESYLVTEYVSGPNFADILRRGNRSEAERSKAAGPVLELLERLAVNRITHGDLKHTNILVTKEGPVLTDLDGMKVHRCRRSCRRKLAKDLESFHSRGREDYGNV
jgi:tRNA A-37 threonylcarbamoyl transferase component Bud32